MSRASNPLPQKCPPPMPSSKTTRSTASHASRSGLREGPLGAFWSTDHAKDTIVLEDKGSPTFDDESLTLKEDRSQSDIQNLSGKASPAGRENSQANPVKFSSTTTFENEAFNTFVAEFDTSKVSPTSNGMKLGKDSTFEAQIDRLRDQLKEVNAEKAEITSKYEKLAAICRSQRHELQELKQALVARTPSPQKETTGNQSSSRSQAAASQGAKNEGTVWELQHGLFDKSFTSPETKPWQAFVNDTNTPTSIADLSKSVRTRSGHSSKQDASAGSTEDDWGFGNDNFTAVPAASSQISTPGEGNTSQRFGDPHKLASETTVSQPAGWAGF